MCRELHEDEDFYGPVMGRLWVSYEPAMGKLRPRKKVYPKILSFCHPKDDNFACHFCHFFGVSQKVTKVTILFCHLEGDKMTKFGGETFFRE